MASAGVARRAVDRARSELQLRLWRDYQHVWHALRLDAQRPHPRLPDGLRLVIGEERHLPLLATIPATGQLMARDWLRAGTRLFLVLDSDDRAVFAAWVFHREVSISVAPGGWLPLPDGVGALDECYVAAGHRGRGIAPAAWSLIADALEQEGDEALLGIAVENDPSARRVLAKAGFDPITRMSARRRLFLVRLRGEPDGELGRRVVERWPTGV